ncbi:MAG TPA: hypothetical protein VLV83_08600 [Acidobacteriota bacterium]|nr:hypothetical protein [Acidobacteriota bacterium]
MQRTLFSFQADLFNTTEEKDDYFNPGNHGQDAAAWLAKRLQEQGATVGKVDQEDYGWYFFFTCDDQELCLVIGYRPGIQEPALWVGWVERKIALWKAPFVNRRQGIAPAALTRVHEVLQAEKGISNVRWHDYRDFEKGQEEGAPEPFGPQ